MENLSAIKVNELSVRYGNTVVLDNVSLDVKKGDFLGIIGPNGGGKTTLLKAILGLIKYDSGTVSFPGISNKKGMLGYVPQFVSMNRSFPISVLEVAMSAYMSGPMHPFFKYTKSHRDNAMRQLERMGLADLADRRVEGLSGGEFQRLLIARALTLDPEVLLLDEPTASVDPVSASTIYQVFKELNLNGVTIIMVTHDTSAISSEVKSIACLNRTLIYHGEPELSADTLGALYNCPVDLIAHGVPHRVLSSHSHSHSHIHTHGGNCCNG